LALFDFFGFSQALTCVKADNRAVDPDTPLSRALPAWQNRDNSDCGEQLASGVAVLLVPKIDFYIAENKCDRASSGWRWR
jgi:hypothetical protein